MSAARRPRCYFNLRSPYSWLAVHDLEHRYPDVAQAIQWRPFWEPGLRDQQWLRAAGGSFPYSPMTKDKHLYILQDVKRLATDRGLTVRWPVDVDPRWEVAHHRISSRADTAGTGSTSALSAARDGNGARTSAISTWSPR